MKYYSSDVTSGPQVGSRTGGILWAQGRTLSAGMRPPLVLSVAREGVPSTAFPPLTQTGLAQSSGPSTVLELNQSPQKCLHQPLFWMLLVAEITIGTI